MSEKGKPAGWALYKQPSAFESRSRYRVNDRALTHRFLCQQRGSSSTTRHLRLGVARYHVQLFRPLGERICSATRLRVPTVAVVRRTSTVIHEGYWMELNVSVTNVKPSSVFGPTKLRKACKLPLQLSSSCKMWIQDRLAWLPPRQMLRGSEREHAFQVQTFDFLKLLSKQSKHS